MPLPETLAEPLRRRHLRRADERQRQGRVHPRARPTGSAWRCEEEKPFLGICLGAQMLANHLGAKVGFHPEELVEIGYYPLATTARGQPLRALPRSCLPVASRRLRAAARRAAACHLRRRLSQSGLRLWPGAIGVQFHPEITYAQVHRWTGHNHARLGMKGARERHEHIAGPHRPRAQGARLARPLPRPLGQGANSRLIKPLLGVS